jgi:hypothetical protein
LNFGIDRKPVNQIFQLQNEFGASGEIVSAAVNDDKNQIRFVGAWANTVDAAGQYITTSTTNDFIEVVFYGTGLNLLIAPAASMDFRATVDGGTEGANLAVTYSTVLNARNTNSNTLIQISSGLTLGIHTVKIRNNAAAGLRVMGVEYVVSQTSIQLNSGISYLQGKKLALGSAALYSPSTDVTGTRGGRMLVYHNSDGTIGRAFQATNGSSATLTSADHTNEEVARTYNFREFGANRADDFSSLASSSSSRVFTLDDGTTCLITDAAVVQTNNGREQITPTGNTNFVSLTFIGTGLDLVTNTGASVVDGFNVTVDGSSIGSIIGTSNATSTRKIVSGLPYGTHIVRFTRNSGAGTATGISQFIVYQPKKPTLPSGAIELADYNVMANYVANATGGADTIGTGTLRKSSTREQIYLGTWTASLVTSAVAGYTVGSSTTSDYVQYTFFGTGFDLRFGNTTVSTTWQFNLDGSTNLSGFTTSSYGTSVTSFTAATGTLVTNTTSANGNGVSISGLSLGLHTIKVTKTAGTGALNIEALDIITPIHSHKSDTNYDQQNTLPIGSQAISDNREFTPVKEVNVKKTNISQAFGVTSSPTTTSSTPVPVPEMSVVHNNRTGRIKISYSAEISSSILDGNVALQAYVDGIAVGTIRNMHMEEAGGSDTVMDMFVIPVSVGTHKIDIYWTNTSGGTASAVLTRRNILVEEIN